MSAKDSPLCSWSDLYLPQAVRPSKYTLHVKTTLQEPYVVNGQVDIQLTAAEATPCVVLHAYGMDIKSVALLVYQPGADLHKQQPVTVKGASQLEGVRVGVCSEQCAMCSTVVLPGQLASTTALPPCMPNHITPSPDIRCLLVYTHHHTHNICIYRKQAASFTPIRPPSTSSCSSPMLFRWRRLCPCFSSRSATHWLKGWTAFTGAATSVRVSWCYFVWLLLRVVV